MNTKAILRTTSHYGQDETERTIPIDDDAIDVFKNNLIAHYPNGKITERGEFWSFATYDKHNGFSACYELIAIEPPSPPITKEEATRRPAFEIFTWRD